MKIEKINDNQIRFTLTREDLEQRQIKLSELAYGSAKAKALFREMLRWASYKYGFEAEDIPLMVEAIPISAETLVLIVTKVPYPEELDPRFSRFSEGDAAFADSEDYYDDDDDGLFSDEDLEDLLSTSSRGPSIPKLSYEGSADDIVKIYGSPMPEEEDTSKEKKDTAEKEPKEIPNITRIYRFNDFDALVRAAAITHHLLKGASSLVRDHEEHYYLTIRRDDTSVTDFNRMMNILAEYGTPQKETPGLDAYLKEQYQMILPDHALSLLADI